MSNKQAYVSWILCCMHEEQEHEHEPGQNGEPGFLKVWAATREGFRAKVAALTAKGWVLREW